MTLLALQTIVMLEPQLPQDWNAIVAADLHTPMGADWERLIAEATLAGIRVNITGFGAK